MDAFKELFEMSMKERKGLTFYIGGQSIGGAVSKIHDNGIVEVRSQVHSRILIRVDRIDAVAAI